MVVGDIFIGGFIGVIVQGCDQFDVIVYVQVVVVLSVICVGVQIFIFMCDEVVF